MQRYWAVLFVALLMLSGCGANSSTHGTEKDIRVDLVITNHGSGNITITSPLGLESESSTTQETAGTATSTPTLRLQLTEGASTAAQGAAKLKDISNVLKPAAPVVPKIGATPVEKKPVEVEIPAVIDAPVTPVEPEPTKPEPEPTIPDSDEVYVEPPLTGESTDQAYKNQTTYTSYGVRNGRQAWRIANKGPEFGQPIKLVFSSGKEFTVKDTSKNCRDQPSCSRNSKAAMYGFVFKPGIGPNGEGDSDTGTSHGGVYLQAPWGDDSKTVTIHYTQP